MKNKVFDYLLPILPKHELSHWVGRLVHHRLPDPLARLSVEAFAKAYNINMSEAEYPIDHYKTIGELFVRRLKPGLRPIGLEPVHPVDAVVSQAGKLDEQVMVQAKGHSYTACELLRNTHWSPVFKNGSYLTYYLCPTDYHRVHVPVSGRLIWASHIPGELWPVNEWSVNRIERLFAINERLAMIFDTPRGHVAVVMVAATNVGNMSVHFDESLATPVRGAGRAVKERAFEISMSAGDELGVFHMGSTVVVLFQDGMLSAVSEWQGQKVRMGEPLVLGL